MREIKFRGYDKKSQKMYQITDINFSDYSANGVCYGDWKEFSINNLLQYTGLKDKNGIEIYEGDIVNFQHIDDYGYMTNVFQNGFYRGVVKWGGHYPGFDIFDIKDNSTFGFDCNIFSMESDIVIEVIGNIYENPELLKNED